MLEPVILFIAAFAAAAISGAAGFGGALLLLPLLVAMVGVTQAVPLLTIAQFKRMPREAFQRFVAILLVAIAGYMVVHG